MEQDDTTPKKHVQIHVPDAVLANEKLPSHDLQ
jgi:hypothetical protein